MARRCVVLKGNPELICNQYPCCDSCCYYQEPKEELKPVVWRRAKSGRNFGKDTVVLYDGDPDARMVRCAVYDCKYIHVEDLLRLPVEDGNG